MTDHCEQKRPAGSEATLPPVMSDVGDQRPQEDVSEETVTDLGHTGGVDDATPCTEPYSSSNGESSPREEVTEKDEKLTQQLRERKLPQKVRLQHVHNADQISPLERPDSVGLWPDEKRDLDSAANESEAVPVILTFKKGWAGKYVPLPEQKLRNNLSGAVGYLEFANALDFAANVWNTIPVPTFAAALMGVGGGIAIILSFYALRDGIKAWRNVKLIRGERAHFKSVAQDEEKAADVIDGHDLGVKIEVNRRELGQEIVDRLAMDVFMGFSSLVVGVGTMLAIGGANPRVFRASNLLSGYIGNSPSAFWGLGNTLWSVYLFRRARRHYVIGTRDLAHETVKARLKKRTRAVRVHSFIMGLATLVSAPSGLITATMWQGYPPLVPCIILAKWGNVIWKRHLGYTRSPMSATTPSVNPKNLIRELEWTFALQDALHKDKKSKNPTDVSAHCGTDSITTFMSKCGLLENLCLELLRDEHLKHHGEDVIQVDQANIEGYERTAPAFARTASSLLHRKGLRALAYRERHLLELLGASVYDAAVRRQETTRG